SVVDGTSAAISTVALIVVSAIGTRRCSLRVHARARAVPNAAARARNRENSNVSSAYCQTVHVKGGRRTSATAAVPVVAVTMSKVIDSFLYELLGECIMALYASLNIYRYD